MVFKPRRRHVPQQDDPAGPGRRPDAHQLCLDARRRLFEELGINVLYGGHYATETFGVKALAEHLQDQFGLPWSFVDHPTGM